MKLTYFLVFFFSLNLVVFAQDPLPAIDTKPSFLIADRFLDGRFGIEIHSHDRYGSPLEAKILKAKTEKNKIACSHQDCFTVDGALKDEILKAVNLDSSDTLFVMPDSKSQPLSLPIKDIKTIQVAINRAGDDSIGSMEIFLPSHTGYKANTAIVAIGKNSPFDETATSSILKWKKMSSKILSVSTPLGQITYKKTLSQDLLTHEVHFQKENQPGVEIKKWRTEGSLEPSTAVPILQGPILQNGNILFYIRGAGLIIELSNTGLIKKHIIPVGSWGC